MSVELPYHRLKIGWLFGVALAFALFAVIGAYSARMTDTYPGFDHDRAVARFETLAKVRQAEDKLLNPVDAQGKPTAAWVDQDKGLIQIPIDEAMTHELDDLKNRAPGQGAEIPGAAAAPAPAPAPAETNAAPAAAKPVTSPLATPPKKMRIKAKTPPPTVKQESN